MHSDNLCELVDQCSTLGFGGRAPQQFDVKVLKKRCHIFDPQGDVLTLPEGFGCAQVLILKGIDPHRENSLFFTELLSRDVPFVVQVEQLLTLLLELAKSVGRRWVRPSLPVAGFRPAGLQLPADRLPEFQVLTEKTQRQDCSTE